MSTETYDPSRLLLSMRGSTALYQTEIEAAMASLAHLSPAEAEDLVAIAGEDERAYGLRDRRAFLDAFCRRADEFLADDEGGFHTMTIHLTRYDRSPAALEIWFHVASPASAGRGVWFRHFVVGINDQCIFADIGPRESPTRATDAVSPSSGTGGD